MGKEGLNMSDRFLLEECPNCKYDFAKEDLLGRGYFLAIGDEITCLKCKKKIVATMNFETIKKEAKDEK